MAAPSPAPKSTQEVQELPINLAGGNHFGRYDKISAQETWNMIVSDGALVDYSGYSDVFTSPGGLGRGIYNSTNAGQIIAVWGEVMYALQGAGHPVPVFSIVFQHAINTGSGDVFITENNNKEIVITDGTNMYVYNWGALTFQSSFYSASYVAPPDPTTQFYVPFENPGYVSFQNGKIIVANLETTNWYLSAVNAATSWPFNSGAIPPGIATYIGAIQTKPDTIQACVPVPGGGNSLLVIGHTVVEEWQDQDIAKFPYKKASTFNVDYGCLNASSIAALDEKVFWIGANEQGGATVMEYDARSHKVQSISTDGIDFVLSTITNPTNCTGFLFRQDGHLLYQFCFPSDNISYVYDIESKLFFTVTDENLNYHIARNVVFYNQDFYFVSLNGPNLFQFGTQYTNFNYGDGNIVEIPRMCISAPIRLDSQRMFIIKSVGITIESGQPNTGLECIDLSISRNGGQTFGNAWRNYMPPTGQQKSRMIWQRCGQANDASIQFKFLGYNRFVVMGSGVAEVYS